MQNYEEIETLLDQPMYTAAEIGRLVGLSSDRVRRWLQGYHFPYQSQLRQQPPVIKRNGSAGERYASFLDLVDLLLVKRFLEHGLSLQKVRKALDETAVILNTRHFARRSFFTNGHNIYLEVKGKGKAILKLLSGGQWVIPGVIEKLAEQIEFDSKSELAQRWYPLGPKGLIVLDPLISFGRPTIIGKAVDTLNVYDFFLAEGQKNKPVCRWLNLREREVEAAVRFEEQLAA